MAKINEASGSVRSGKSTSSLPEFSLDVLSQKTRLSTPAISHTSELPRKKSDYAFDNKGFSGSRSGLSMGSATIVIEPPTSVVREQYWTCSKWPKAQRFLAIAVAILVGALIGLAVAFSLKIPKKDTVLGPFFRTSA